MKGDHLEDRLDRFEPGGKYHTWYANGKIQDWLVLDFRTTIDGRCEHVGLDQVRHVVYDLVSEVPGVVNVVDNKGEAVRNLAGRELRFSLTQQDEE